MYLPILSHIHEPTNQFTWNLASIMYENGKMIPVATHSMNGGRGDEGE
jgi:hypothetical protein